MPFADIDWNDNVSRLVVGILVFLCTTMLTVLSWVFGRWWGKRQARMEWSGTRPMDRVINVNVNSLIDGRLVIRTIMERTMIDIFRNDHAIDIVHEAVRQTSPENPLLPLPEKEAWPLLNCILNAVSEQFGAGVLRHSAGEPVKAVRYSIFLTYEHAGPNEIRKVRALLIQEDVLAKLANLTEPPKLESPNHIDRVTALKQVARQQSSKPHCFMTMEVYL